MITNSVGDLAFPFVRDLFEHLTADRRR